MAQPVPTDPGRILTELYKEHSAEAFRFALHLTGRRADAEDVVQHVFLQAHRHIAGGRALVSPRAWLLTAVKHRAYNLARDRREIPLDQADAPAPPRDVSRDEAAELAEVRGMLWTLPESQHQAFVLRHWSGLSQREIAHVLGTTPAAVESLLVRARAALVRSHESAPETCKAVRGHLLDPAPLGSADRDHLGTCRTCRHAQARLMRAANLATSLALVPGTHVADSLAHLIPGFSAHAATSTAAAGTAGTGTAGAGAGAAGTGAGAGASGVTATLGTTAATTAGKVAIAAKATLAALAATAVVSTAPAAVSSLVVHHTAASAPQAPRHHSRQTASPSAPAVPPVQGPMLPARGGPSGHTPPGDQGNRAGSGKGSGGKPTAPGTAKPADPGNGKALGPGGNGKPAGAGDNGQGGGKPAGAGGTGNGGGKPAGAGGAGNVGGAGSGGGKPAGGAGSGGGKPAGTDGGKPAGAGGGKP